MTKFCPKCGEQLVDEAKFCKNCGANIETITTSTNMGYDVPVVEKSHTLAIVVGYIGAILIPIVGVALGIYLYTRNDSEKAKRHGTFILIIAVVVWILSIMMILR